MIRLFVIFAVFAYADSGDTGAASDSREEACHDAFDLAVENLVARDPSLVDPCGIYDVSDFDAEAGVCSFECGSDSHWEVIQ